MLGTPYLEIQGKPLTLKALDPHPRGCNFLSFFWLGGQRSVKVKRGRQNLKWDGKKNVRKCHDKPVPFPSNQNDKSTLFCPPPPPQPTRLKPPCLPALDQGYCPFLKSLQELHKSLDHKTLLVTTFEKPQMWVWPQVPLGGTSPANPFSTGN